MKPTPPLRQIPNRKGIDPYALWGIDTGFNYSQQSYVYEAGAGFVKFIAEVAPSAADLKTWLQPWNKQGPDWLRVAPEYVENQTVEPNQSHFVSGYIGIDAVLWLLWDGQHIEPTKPADAEKFWQVFKRLQLAADVRQAVPFLPATDAPLIVPVSLPKATLNQGYRADSNLTSGSIDLPIQSPLPEIVFTFAGLIDVGIPFASRECRDWHHEPPLEKSTPRLRAYWDQQDGLSAFPPPSPPSVPPPSHVQGFNYGREWFEGGKNTPSVTQLVADVDSVTKEEERYRVTESSLALRARSHGAATLGELTSHRLSANSDKNDGDAAGFAPILAVQLPRPTMAHSSLGALSAHVLDGLRWLIARAGPNNNLVTNISLGTQAGPHDGTSILECAIDELIRLRKRGNDDRLAVAMAAGNSREARCHAAFRIPSKSVKSLSMRVLPDSRVPVYLEIWHESNASLSVSIRSPAGAAIPRVSVGRMDRLTDNAGETVAAVYNMGSKSALGNHSVVLVAIASTANGQAASGDWTICIDTDLGVTECHAYVERNNSMFDVSKPRGRQARFVDENYAIAGLSPADIGDSAGATIRRRGTLNSVSTGTEVIVAGAFAGSDRVASTYTGEGPTRGGTIGVDAGAMGDASRLLKGVRVLATRSGDTTRMNGSSIASPRLARRALNYLIARGPDPVKKHIAKLAFHETGTVKIDPFRMGSGVLNEARVEEPRLKHD